MVGGTIYFKLYNLDGSVVQAEKATNITGCDDKQFTVISRTFLNSQRIVLSVFQSGNLNVYTSTGFANFT